jgi:hypothetical protein
MRTALATGDDQRAAEGWEAVAKTIGSTDPSVLLVNPVSGAPGTRGAERAPSRYVDIIGPSFLRGTFHSTFPAEPTYFNQLAAQLRAGGLSVELLDGLCHGVDAFGLADVMGRFTSPVVCFAVFHNTVGQALALARLVKQRDPTVVTIFGGAYATNVWTKLVRCSPVDHVVIGDGEQATVAAAQATLAGDDPAEVPGVATFRNGKVKYRAAPALESLDEFAWPARDLVPLVQQHGLGVSAYSSRGCAFGRCSFCYLVPYQEISGHPKWRARSAEDVVDELEDLVRQGVDRVTFVDEDFVGPSGLGVERMLTIAKLIIERDVKIRWYVNALVKSMLALARDGHLPLLARAGLDSVFMGFESTSKERLKSYLKPQRPQEYDEVIDALAAHGIKINPGLITFDGDMGLDELITNVDLIRRMRYWDLFILTRTLVDLSDTFEVAARHDGLGSLEGPLESWDEGPADGLERARSEMADARVAVVLHAMRRFLNRTFKSYDLLSRRADIVSLRDRAIELHLAAFDEAVAYAQESEGVVTAEDVELLADRWAEEVQQLVDAPLTQEPLMSTWS